MRVVYRAHNLIDAHLAKHLLEDAGLPAFVFGESLLGGAGELPMIGVLRVCVPDGFEAEAAACLEALSESGSADDDGLAGIDPLPA
ncbi:MAG TPA: DUF2007 domain-containing protein [Pseudoxanthomonas sp.]|nr:DUF2007 domain-containing protein [Pseudoxanthomonas sp.]